MINRVMRSVRTYAEKRTRYNAGRPAPPHRDQQDREQLRGTGSRSPCYQSGNGNSTAQFMESAGGDGPQLQRGTARQQQQRLGRNIQLQVQRDQLSQQLPQRWSPLMTIIYQNLVGKAGLFREAPPAAEVISEGTYIFAEAYKTGAMWWDRSGKRSRRRIMREHISNYHCVASLQPAPEQEKALEKAQQAWDKRFNVPPESSKQAEVKTHFVTGETGMNTPLTPSPDCGVFGAHFCMGPRPKTFPVVRTVDDLKATAQQPDEFVSVFAQVEQEQPWIRINKDGRIKFCKELAERFAGKLVDICLSVTGNTLPVGEPPGDRPLSAIASLQSAWLARQVEMGEQASQLVWLKQRKDGCYYGFVPLKKDNHGAAHLER